MIETKDCASPVTPDRPFIADLLTFRAKAIAWRTTHPSSKAFRVPQTRADELLLKGMKLADAVAKLEKSNHNPV